MQVNWAKSYLVGCSWKQCETIRNLHTTTHDDWYFTVCYYGPTYVQSPSVAYLLIC